MSKINFGLFLVFFFKRQSLVRMEMKNLVTVFSKNECVFCDLTCQYLKNNSIPHEIVEDGQYNRDDLMTKTESRKFPQVFVKEQYIGGYEDLKKLNLKKVTDHRLKEITGEVVEPMTIEAKEFDRFILFDGQKEKEFNDIYMLYKKQLACFWTVEEIDCSDDLVHLEKSSEGELHFLKMILCFFASLDEVVTENIGVNFIEEFKNPIIRLHFATQNFFEQIHAETYSILISTYIKDPSERLRIMKAAQTVPIINKKIKWVETWMNPKYTSLAERILSMVILEGVQFSGAFCAIFYFKKQGKFPGLCFSNSLISRDESCHALGGCILYEHLEHKLPEERVHEMMNDAVLIEKEFIKEALPVKLIGMNENEMATYIEFVADHWLSKLGYSKLYKSNNPFPWMELLGNDSKGNFFEVKISEYAKAGVLVEEDDNEFTIGADF